MKKGYHWLNIIQDCFFPPTCLLCGHDGDNGRDVCPSCHLDLPWNTACCARCAAILATRPSAAALCGQCLSHPPAFDETHAPFVYQDTIRHLITALKFKADHQNARLLGQLLAEHLIHSAHMPELIVPVPLHPARYRKRGFNQAIEIARTVAKELSLPLDLTCCRRLRDTAQQTSLSGGLRRHNLKKAFAAVQPLKAKHVAILDDVMTTGSTTHELALVLKKAGVERVDVWVCARASGFHDS